MLSMKDLVVVDGAMGTELEHRGYGGIWSGRAVQLEDPDAVRDCHQAYVNAGAQVLITNTYACNAMHLSKDKVVHANTVAVEIAQSVAKEAQNNNKDQKVLVVGSVSNHPPVKPGTVGNLTMLADWPTPNEETEAYRQQAQALSAAGIERFFLEMCKDWHHSMRLVTAVVETGKPFHLGVTVRRHDMDDNVSVVETEMVVMRDAAPHVLELDEMLRQTKAELERMNCLHLWCGTNIMHSNLDAIEPALRVIQTVRDEIWQAGSHIIGVYPNQGVFQPPKYDVPTPLSKDEFVDYARCWYALGAQWIGGCCGFGADYIESLAKAKEGV